MKKLGSIIIILFYGATCASAQTGWFPLRTIFSKGMQSIYFINADTGFLSTYGGSFKTTDGGRSWSPIIDKRIGVFGVGGFISFSPSKKTGYIGNSLTVDSGNTWLADWNTKGINGHIFILSDSEFFSGGATEGFAMNLVFGKRLNNGPWTFENALQVDSPVHIKGCKAISFRDKDHGVMTVAFSNDRDESDWASSYYTSNGGKSWVLGSYTAFQYLWLHDSTWLIGNSTLGVIKSYDDFKNFKSSSDSTFYLNDLCVPFNGAYALANSDSNNIVSMDRGDGAIFRSTDAGNSWYQQLCFPSQSLGFNLGLYGSVSLPTKLVGYAVGIDSQIYKTIDGGGPPFTSGVIHSPIEAQSFDILSNPIASSADFQFSPLLEPKVLELFDLLGRSFLRRELLTGQVSIHVDMQAFPAGIYFARLGGKSLKVVKM